MLVDNINIGFGNRTPFSVLPGSGKTVATGGREVTCVECAEARYTPLIHRALSNLIGGYSLACVCHCSKVKAVFPLPYAVTQNPVPFPEIRRIHPRTIIVFVFKSAKQVPVSELYRVGKELAFIAAGPDGCC